MQTFDEFYSWHDGEPLEAGNYLCNIQFKATYDGEIKRYQKIVYYTGSFWWLSYGHEVFSWGLFNKM